MTEDDTFRKLKQIPFKDVCHMLDRLIKDCLPTARAEAIELATRAFCEESGWTREEWNKECKRLGVDR